MRAMVIRSSGSPDVFAERELPKPSPGPGELLVRVMATAVDPVDAKIPAGGRWAGVEPPAVLGYDGSGVVESVGPGGELYCTPEILGNPSGSYAGCNVVRAGIVALKPKGPDQVTAAAVPSPAAPPARRW